VFSLTQADQGQKGQVHLLVGAHFRYLPLARRRTDLSCYAAFRVSVANEDKDRSQGSPCFLRLDGPSGERDWSFHMKLQHSCDGLARLGGAPPKRVRQRCELVPSLLRDDEDGLGPSDPWSACVKENTQMSSHRARSRQFGISSFLTRSITFKHATEALVSFRWRTEGKRPNCAIHSGREPRGSSADQFLTKRDVIGLVRSIRK